MAENPAPSKTLPLILLVVGGGVYGSVFSANKFAIEAGFPFLAYTFWQALLSAAALLVLGAATRSLPRMSPAHLRQYGVTTLFGYIIPIAVFAYVAAKVPPLVLTLLLALTPALTYLFAFAMRLEKFRAASVLGVVFGFLGILLIVLPEGSLPSPEAAVWLVLALLAPLGFAANNVSVALLRPPASTSIGLSAGVLLVASAVMFVVMLVADGFVAFWSLPPAAVWGVVWAAGVNAITFWFLFEIIRLAGPVFFSQFNYVSIGSGFLWALVLFQDLPSTWVWIALVAMVIGLVLATRGANQSIREAAAKN
jgi:drug/metabolite transporter (DMT)-like permease